MNGDAVARGGRAAARAARWTGRHIRGQVVKRVGGAARARVIVMFAAVLALNGADTATVGAVAPQLEHALHIGDTKIGLLSAVSLLIGAVFTIPVGLFVDRTKRMPLLAISIILWSVATLFSAFAANYSSLLLTRLALGAVAATAGPAIASLTGDYFPASERGRIWAYILGGEVVGTAAGFIVSGSIANLLIVIGSSLGFFYLGGLNTFALLFVKGQYHASQATAELVLAMLVVGAIVGTLLGGRITDVLLRRGNLEARVWFPAACYIGA